MIYEFRYGSGPNAVHSLELWPDNDVRRALEVVQDVMVSKRGLDRLVGQASPDTRRRAAEESLRQDADGTKTNYLKRAIGLHIGLAGVLWAGGDHSRLLNHINLVQRYLFGPLAGRDPEYAALSCRVSGALLTGNVYFSAALTHYERCLKFRPDDPWLLMGRAATLEAAEMTIATLPPGRVLTEWSGSRDAGTLRRSAEDGYERVLRQSPNLDEARIRLGRLQLVRDDLIMAARNLSAPLSGRPAPILDFWRHLFLGRLKERAGSFVEAADQYRAALVLYPNAQSAAIALSYVMAEGLSDEHGSLDMLRAHIAPGSDRSFESDPWHVYPGGQAWRAPEWLDELERRSRE